MGCDEMVWNGMDMDGLDGAWSRDPILTPDGGVQIEVSQRIGQQADSGHDVEK